MKTVKPLSTKQIDAAKPKDTAYRLYDGNGLSLLISKHSKIWHFNYYKPFSKSRTMISFGRYPEVSLATARSKRDECRSLLAQNIDPQKHEQEKIKQKQQDNQNTFAFVSQLWLSHQNYAKNTLMGAKRYLKYANRFLADKPISDINSHDIINLCQWCEQEHGGLMASGVKTKIAQILDFAIGRHMLSHNIARTLRHTHKQHVPGNHPAITDPKAFAKLLQDIENTTDVSFITKQFLRLAPYVFVRPNELASMNINDIDWQSGQWRYTPSKTKQSTGVDLIVPLSTQALQIIKETIAYHGQAYVFYSPRGKDGHINHKRSSQWLRQYYANKQTLHGLRASAKTMLEEVEGLEYDPRYVEMQLGHTVKDANGTAYNRAKFIRQRTNMMQAWADYLDSLKILDCKTD